MKPLAIALSAVFLATICVSTQSLPELAEKEKKRREELREQGASRTITEDELRSGRAKSSSRTDSDSKSLSQKAKPSCSTRRPARDESAPTETDRRRQQALSKLESKFRQMVERGNELITTARAYNQADCVVGTGQPRHPQCDAMEQKIGTLACAVGTSLDDVEDIAREGYLPAGLVRQAREETGLNNDIWRDLQNVAREHCTSD